MVTVGGMIAAMGMRRTDDDICCGGCGEVVYPGPGPFVIANHHFTRLRDGRVHWWSRDFEVTVHLCRSPATEAAVAAIPALADRMLAG